MSVMSSIFHKVFCCARSPRARPKATTHQQGAQAAVPGTGATPNPPPAITAAAAPPASKPRRGRPKSTPDFPFEFPLDGTNVDPWDAEANEYLNKILGSKENWQLWTESALDRMTLRTVRELTDEEKRIFMEKAGGGRF